VEERVVLLRARSFDEALRKGESEAKAYAKAYQLDSIGRRPATLRNPYGQPLLARYLGAIDVYEMSEPPNAGVEVFSSTSLISSVMSDRALVDARFGEKEGHRGARTKFLNGQLSGRTWWIPPVRNTRRGKS
jgi:hypothetical protein